MAIPDYQTLMLPVLQLVQNGAEYKFRTAVETLAEQFNLIDEERAELLPSGSQPIFDNRVGWARTYLKQAGLIDSTRRGFFHITERGKRLLDQHPAAINVKFLEQFDEFQEFRKRKKDKSDSQEAIQNEKDIAETPDDALAKAYQKLRADVEARILQQVKEISPSFFERIVIDLLVTIGYGGSREDAGRAIGRSRDGGIDGIINEDRLGLDVIYIQAKRWEATVGRPEIQKFAGALQGQRAKKGIFITTSNFSREAEQYAAFIDSRIILIDGARLVKLMFENNVGVSTVGSYQIKRIDSDYFEDE